MHRRSLDYYLLLKNMASSETELCRKSAIFQVITQPIEVIKSASDWNYKVFTEANFYLSILANPKSYYYSEGIAFRTMYMYYVGIVHTTTFCCFLLFHIIRIYK